MVMRAKTLPIFLAFFLMGLADAMGPMSDGVKKQYELGNLVATLLPFFVFIAFAVSSLPGGLMAARIGKKNLLLLGLGLNAVALLIPSLQMPSFALLLGCIFLLGIGTTFLQVAGNPIMRDVSAEGSYSRNLSLAQGIKGIGSTLSTYLISAMANALTLIDGLAVVGGGISAAWPLFLPALVSELNGTCTGPDGKQFRRLASAAFNLADPDATEKFFAGDMRQIAVPRGSKKVAYDPLRRIGVGISRLGTSEAVAIGAYAYALRRLDEQYGV
jgi:MFS family permease